MKGRAIAFALIFAAFAASSAQRAANADDASKTSNPANASAANDANTGAANDTRQSREPHVTFEERWVGTSFGGYLPPAGDAFIDDTGGVDLVFHFHGAMLATRSWRASDLRAVIVSRAFSTFGTDAYDEAFSDHARFGKMLDEVLASVARAHGRDHLHARRITLVGFSAGFAAVSKILSVPRYFDMVDDVILLDGLHAKYKLLPNEEKHAAMGADHVWTEQLTTITKFAREALLGNKALIITHSNIVPPDYASTAETATALLRDLGVRREEDSSEIFGMRLRARGDLNLFHVLGFRGNEPDDHMNHLYAVGDVVRTFIVPRQRARDAIDRRAHDRDGSRAGL